MYIVDSSVWVSLFLDNDSMHGIAVEILKKIDNKILLPYCVINEVTTVLAYKHSNNIGGRNEKTLSEDRE